MTPYHGTGGGVTFHVPHTGILERCLANDANLKPHLNNTPVPEMPGTETCLDFKVTSNMVSAFTCIYDCSHGDVLTLLLCYLE